MDSVGRDIEQWIGQMPSTNRGVEELRQRISRISRLFDRILDHAADTHSISRGDLTALSVIIRTPGPSTPGSLARTLEVTSGTISTRLKRLSAAGLIDIREGEVDARRRPVEVTELGRSLWAAATSHRTHLESQILGNALASEQLEHLNDGLSRVLSSLEHELGPTGAHDLPRKDSGT